MRLILTALIFVSATSGSTTAFATQLAAEAVENQILSTQTAQHAVRGYVTAISATSLAISTSSTKPTDVCFVLTPSTVREGAIVIGAAVSIRYRTDGKVRVATVVIVRGMKHSPVATSTAALIEINRLFT